jgi:hypothetical protein
MRLWTLQDPPVWEALQRDKVLLVDSNHLEVDHHFKVHAYPWLAKQMQQRIPGCKGNFPWWAWYRPKPDMRDSRWRFNYDGTPIYRIELEVPDHLVLLSDFDGWHAVLNHCYLALSEEEDNEFDRLCNRLIGLPEDADVSWRWPSIKGIDPEQLSEARKTIQQKIEESWERCFDIEAFGTNEYWGNYRKDTMVQATFEELRLEYVVSAKAYTGYANRKR